jgi:catechol 2,3-dioxygenase-like lactoylglutathione lyase family enzyme
MTPADSRMAVVDLVPFLRVADVERSIRFYEVLGFEVVKRHAPSGRLGSIGGHPSPPRTLARLRARFHASRRRLGIAGWVRR